MVTKRLHPILFIVITSLMLSSCSTLTPSGMPTFASNADKTKSATAIPGKDFKLIPITYNTISKPRSNYHRPKHGKATGTGGYEYRIGSQDILSVTVWDHPELTIPAGEFRSATAAGHLVGKDGKFFFPFAGKVQAKGLTTSQVRQDLEKKLSKYITKPQVGVSIAAYRSQKAYVSGEVANTGVLPINDIPLTVRDVISNSGGLTKAASNTALLVHNNKKIRINLDNLLERGDNSQNYVLRGGDTLHIDKNNKSSKTFVMGEVKNAKSVSFDQYGLTLAEALSEAGGLNEDSANPTGVFVIRQGNLKDRVPTVFQLRLTSVHSMLLAERFKLRPRDIVYVTATPLVRWNRVISRILPSLSGIDAVDSVTN